MRRGTTPTYTIKFDDNVDMDRVEDICLTFEQISSGTELSKHIKDDGFFAKDGGYVTLSQSETRSFSKGTVKRQVLVKFKDGTVKTSDIEKENVYDVLHEVDH